MVGKNSGSRTGGGDEDHSFNSDLRSEIGVSTAAEGLEAEIARFEKLTATATRTALDSQKHMDFAAQAIQEAADCHARFGEQLRALIDAVAIARDRQQASAATLNARSEEIQKRREQY